MRSTALVVALLLLSLPAFAAEEKSGDALVRSAGKTAVAILVDTNGDKSIDQGFLLDSELPLNVAQAIHADKARVMFDDGYVRLITGDNTIYELYVAGYPEPPAAPEKAKVVRFTGYGITHRTGETRYELAKAEKDEELKMPGW